MSKKYRSLQELRNHDQNAERYFSELPDYVKSQIIQRENNINSLESLKDYAENLLRGDD